MVREVLEKMVGGGRIKRLRLKDLLNEIVQSLPVSVEFIQEDSWLDVDDIINLWLGYTLA